MFQQTKNSGMDLTKMGIVNAALKEVGETDELRIDTQTAHGIRFEINQMLLGL